MIIIPQSESPILADARLTESKLDKLLVLSQPLHATTVNRRQILTRRRKGRVVKASSGKSVSFEMNQQGEVSEHIQKYDEHDFDPCDVYSQDYEMSQCRESCMSTVRAAAKNDPEYRKHLVQIFRTRSYQYTEDDLDMLGGSVCRGLERKLSKVFCSHRRWAVDGVLKMQETNNNQECMRFFSKRASQPCVNFARLLA